MKKEPEQKMTLRFRTTNLRHLTQFQLVLIANEQIILQKSAGAVLMPPTDLNSSNVTNQLTIQKKWKKIWPTQDIYLSLEILPYTRKAKFPVGRLHMSETICHIWHTQNSVPLP